MNWKSLVVLMLLVVGLGGAAYFNKSTKPFVVECIKMVRHQVSSATAEAQDIVADAPAIPVLHSQGPWNRLVPIEPDQETAIGMKLATVEKQEEPMKLELNATTAYDQDSLTQIRPRFSSLVRSVFKTLGSHVSQGDKLVELYSNDLAQAKNDLQVKYVQWLHDQRLLSTREQLVKTHAISELVYIETQNSEAKSKLDYDLAYDQLKVYGLTPEEIDPLLVGLNDKSMLSLRSHNVADKASMILRSPADGIIIKRDVVPGNLYDTTSVLLVIAPLDHLRVYANVYERDIDVIQINQEMIIHFPYLDRSIRCHVEVISNQVDPETHAMRVRATIKNQGDLLKADMLARAELHIKAVDGYTVIPRNALVTTNGRFYVFVKKSGTDPAATEPAKAEAKAAKPEAVKKEAEAPHIAHKSGEAHEGAAKTGSHKEKAEQPPPDLFERREIRVRQELSDKVIVAEGLKPGEEVVSTGSLILAQMYEDLSTVDSGTPLP
ncbi:MAG TPA: efflux RND transporter periplasmic adaptor subunit [Isosphaeraceae bacterium]|jgi:cobalt-zinc-cadmium efflux system membrane fusion protein|nr:efflux RND transporter periplasmic adaptor subunit [Isosphaeraceae bacterium]